jgi:hypothetical protein
MLEYNSPTLLWDLNHTLGYLRRIGWEIEGMEIPDQIRYEESQYGLSDSCGMKHGLKKMLSYFDKNGIAHILTTAATERYANECLRKMGIEKYFEKIFARESIYDFHTQMKFYQPILDFMGFSEMDAQEKLLLVSNDLYDMPNDIDGLVMLEDPNCLVRDSSITQGIIEKVFNMGNGNFSSGFEELFRTTKNGKKCYDHDDPRHDKNGIKEYSFNGLHLRLRYKALEKNKLNGGRVERCDGIVISPVIQVDDRVHNLVEMEPFN